MKPGATIKPVQSRAVSASAGDTYRCTRGAVGGTVTVYRGAVGGAVTVCTAGTASPVCDVGRRQDTLAKGFQQTDSCGALSHSATRVREGAISVPFASLSAGWQRAAGVAVSRPMAGGTAESGPIATMRSPTSLAIGEKVILLTLSLHRY